jgi:hypothetical protein
LKGFFAYSKENAYSKDKDNEYSFGASNTSPSFSNPPGIGKNPTSPYP